MARTAADHAAQINSLHAALAKGQREDVEPDASSVQSAAVGEGRDERTPERAVAVGDEGLGASNVW